MYPFPFFLCLVCAAVLLARSGDGDRSSPEGAQGGELFSSQSLKATDDVSGSVRDTSGVAEEAELGAGVRL